MTTHTYNISLHPRNGEHIVIQLTGVTSYCYKFNSTGQEVIKLQFLGGGYECYTTSNYKHIEIYGA
jgi:hypothetical protein